MFTQKGTRKIRQALEDHLAHWKSLINISSSRDLCVCLDIKKDTLPTWNTVKWNCRHGRLIPFLFCCRLLSRKDYPVISKNMVRQRLISSHSHLAGKLGAGVLTGHPQVLSSYQYETGVPLSNSDPQDPISNHFPQSRDPSLLYHCFKHRGMFFTAVLLVIGQNKTFPLSTPWFEIQCVFDLSICRYYPTPRAWM